MCLQLRVSHREEKGREGRTLLLVRRSARAGCERRVMREKITPMAHEAWGQTKGRVRLPRDVAAQPHTGPPTLICS